MTSPPITLPSIEPPQTAVVSIPWANPCRSTGVVRAIIMYEAAVVPARKAVTPLYMTSTHGDGEYAIIGQNMDVRNVPRSSIGLMP